MRTKIGIFAMLSFFLSFLIFRVFDDDGAGADDLGDFEIQDEDDENEKNEEMEALKAENAKNAEWIEEQKGIIATQEAVASLSEKYPNFDAQKITEYLESIAKEKGSEEADKLNNPLGWEIIHLTEFKRDEKVDPQFDRGDGGSTETFDAKEAMKKAQVGDKEAMAKLLENSKG